MSVITIDYGSVGVGGKITDYTPISGSWDGGFNYAPNAVRATLRDSLVGVIPNKSYDIIIDTDYDGSRMFVNVLDANKERILNLPMKVGYQSFVAPSNAKYLAVIIKMIDTDGADISNPQTLINKVRVIEGA